jgi:hypothetical protein
MAAKEKAQLYDSADAILWLLVIIGLFFLFSGTPDVFDVLQAKVLGTCKP